MEKNLKIEKLSDIVAWADGMIRDGGYNEEKYRSDTTTAYCNVKAYELWRIRDAALKSMERHSVYTDALNNDIADKAAKIDLLEKEIEGRKEGYYALKTQMDSSLAKKDEKAKELININTKEISELNDKIIELKKERDKHIIDRNATIMQLEKQVKYLEKELNETCTCKELDLKGHNRREMALVNELADKNDEIKSLKEENSYLKSEIKQKQNIIKKAYDRYSDDIIKTRKDVLEVAYRDIEKDNGYVGFKLYVKSTLIEAKGDKNEANEVITEAVRSAYTEWDKTQKENEKTIKKAIKEVMNKKYGHAGEIAFRIRSEVDKKRIVDIGEGAEKILGVSRELFDAAIKALVDDGYQEIIGRIPQATNSYVYMDMHVLATPDVETKETANAENIKSLDFDIPCGEDAIE